MDDDDDGELLENINIAKGTTDPGVECFDQFDHFGLVGLVW